MKNKFKRYHYRWGTKKILGILFLLIGILIIFKVIPASIWFFIFAIIFLSIGFYLIKSG